MLCSSAKKYGCSYLSPSVRRKMEERRLLREKNRQSREDRDHRNIAEGILAIRGLPVRMWECAGCGFESEETIVHGQDARATKPQGPCPKCGTYSQRILIKRIAKTG